MKLLYFAKLAPTVSKEERLAAILASCLNEHTYLQMRLRAEVTAWEIGSYSAEAMDNVV